MKVWRSGTSECSAASARASSRLGRMSTASAAAGIQQLAHALDVAGGLPLVPELLPRAAPEPGLARLTRPRESLLVHVGNGEHLSRTPVLDHAREQAGFAEGGLVQGLDLRKALRAA